MVLPEAVRLAPVASEVVPVLLDQVPPLQVLAALLSVRVLEPPSTPPD